MGQDPHQHELLPDFAVNARKHIGDQVC